MRYISVWDLEQIVMDGRRLFEVPERYHGPIGFVRKVRERKARRAYWAALTDWRELSGRQHDYPDPGNRGWIGPSKPDAGAPQMGNRASLKR